MERKCKGKQMWQLARFKHDKQIYGMSRTRLPGWKGRKSTPETRPIQQAIITRFMGFVLRAKLKGKLTLRLPNTWVEYLAKLQITPKIMKSLSIPQTGWFNTGFPRAETIGFGGNACNVERVTKDVYRIQTFRSTNAPPDPKVWNHRLHPELIHSFTVVGGAGNIFKLAVGTAYTFLISDRDMYVPSNEIELFPELPRLAAIVPARGVKVHEQPDVKSLKIVDLPQGTPIVIEEYVLRGSEVWGRISDHGYIVLYYPYYDQPFLTTWTMETTPPPL